MSRTVPILQQWDKYIPKQLTEVRDSCQRLQETVSQLVADKESDPDWEAVADDLFTFVKGKIDELRSEVGSDGITRDDNIMNLQSKISKLEKEASEAKDLSEIVLDLQVKTSQQQEKVAVLDRKITLLDGNFAETTGVLDLEVSELQERLLEQEKLTKGLEQKVEILHQRLATAEKETAKETESRISLEAKFGELKGQLDLVLDKLAVLESAEDQRRESCDADSDGQSRNELSQNWKELTNNAVWRNETAGDGDRRTKRRRLAMTANYALGTQLPGYTRMSFEQGFRPDPFIVPGLDDDYTSDFLA